MKIAFVFPRFKLLSGAERLILELTAALIEKGHSVTLICHQFDPSCIPILPDKATLHITAAKLDYFKNRYMNAVFDYSKAGEFSRILPADSDVVCCFGPALYAVHDLNRNARARRPVPQPVLYFCYEPPRFLYTDRRLILKELGFAGLLLRPAFAIYRWLDRRLVRSADAVLTNSFFGRDQIKEVYGSESFVITHGLNDDSQEEVNRDQIRKQLGFAVDDVVVVTVNYLHPRKRLGMFIDAVAAAAKSDPKVKGLIVGDGPEIQRLKQQAGPEIQFAGFVPERNLHLYYKASDIYLHTARLETFGLSVIEASANSLPVISVNEGGPKETLIDRKTGLLVEAKAAWISEAILQLARDPDLRIRMGREGQRYVREKYSWEKGAEDFLNVARKHRSSES